MIARVKELFPGATVVSEVTYKSWLAKVCQNLKEVLRWPGFPVGCRSCGTLGCDQCNQTGQVALGANPDEEARLEVATRLLLHARYQCRPDLIPWMDQAIDTFCNRWAKVVHQNTPQF